MCKIFELDIDAQVYRNMLRNIENGFVLLDGRQHIVGDVIIFCEKDTRERTGRWVCVRITGIDEDNAHDISQTKMQIEIIKKRRQK